MSILKATLSSFRAFIKEDFNLKSYGLVIAFLAALVTFNFTIDFEDSYLDTQANQLKGWFFYFLFYIGVFLTCMLFMYKHPEINKALKTPKFYLILSVAFAVYLVDKYYDLFGVINTYDNAYFNYKMSSRLNNLGFFILEILILGLLIGRLKDKVFGLLNFNKKLRIYGIFLLFMLPLIYLASQDASFLKVYPRLKVAYFSREEYFNYFLQFEPFYLLTFIRIEWFFRGFLILALTPFLGKRAVLIVAFMYCVYHFGKPLGECISSFFGGYILGMMVYYTRSIWGGVMVHMGIAFLMDLFALMAFFTLV